MTLSIAIDRLHSRFHLAHARQRGSRCFTASVQGYQALVKWSREIAQGEPVVFTLPTLADYGRVLADWLTWQGERVAVRVSA